MGKRDMSLRRTLRRRIGRIAFVCILLLSAWFAFGISGADEAAYRSFDDAANRWQHNPEFRAVAKEYCELGSRAMRTRPLFFSAKREIIAVRSIPGLPPTLAVNPTSRLHYQNFSRGPLSAYLHLCSEQQLDQFIGIFEACGKQRVPSDSDCRQLLNSFHMDFPVAHDPGAVQSVANVLRDAEAYRSFSIRQNIGPLLQPQISKLSNSLGLPPDPTAQTPDQQQAVLDRLDAFVKQHDVELWRSKQISDCCGGIWAQVFAPPYHKVLGPTIFLRNMGHALLILLLFIVLIWQRRRVPTATISADNPA